VRTESGVQQVMRYFKLIKKIRVTQNGKKLFINWRTTC